VLLAIVLVALGTWFLTVQNLTAGWILLILGVVAFIISAFQIAKLPAHKIIREDVKEIEMTPTAAAAAVAAHRHHHMKSPCDLPSSMSSYEHHHHGNSW